MLTPVHNDADDTDNTDDIDDANVDDYNRVTGIALLRAFSCAKMEVWSLMLSSNISHNVIILGMIIIYNQGHVTSVV